MEVSISAHGIGSQSKTGGQRTDLPAHLKYYTLDGHGSFPPKSNPYVIKAVMTIRVLPLLGRNLALPLVS
jgi:hypothetical protein